ncbi:MAG TPA: hypothetical protein VFQ25_08570 [Ktedonobacterales bacterium]|nr:hypothetical protein [Ktedonobacterales bacterium]
MSDLLTERATAPDDERPLAPERSSRRRRWTRRALIILVALAYEAIWVSTAFDKVNPTDLDVFFFPATHFALAGHPLDIYHLRVGQRYPNANGPLGLVPVLLAAWLADLRGWLENVTLRRALVFAIAAIFPLLAGWEVMRVVERFVEGMGERLRGLARALPYVPMALAPELWLSALYYGHIEQIIAVWLTLAALRLLMSQRTIASGALLGLALLARSDVALIILPIALTLAARKRIRDALWLALGTMNALLAGLLPFLIADTRDTLFSLVAFRGALPVGGGNIWSLSDAQAFLSFGQRYDALLALSLAALLTLATLALRRDLTIASPDLFGLLTVTTLCFALLIKTLWPYYYLEAALFATVWASARSVEPLRAHGRQWLIRFGELSLAWLPRVGVLFCALVAEYGLEATSYEGWLPPWGLILALLNLIVVTLTFVALLAGPRLIRLFTSHPEAAPRDILPEIALSAPADGHIR